MIYISLSKNQKYATLPMKILCTHVTEIYYALKKILLNLQGGYLKIDAYLLNHVSHDF